jgi:rod shape-determining protein MreB
LLLKCVSRLLGSDLAVDLGTSNTLVYLKGAGIVVTEPSVVALWSDGRRPSRVESVGRQAKETLGRSPRNHRVVRPIRDGVISNLDATTRLLSYVFARVKEQKFLVQPRVLIAVPAGLNDVERRGVKEAAILAGAGQVLLIEEAMAAALGAGIDVTTPDATMVVDVGGGTTEVALISCSGLIYSKSTRVGGDKMDEAIIQYVRRTYALLIGPLTAERVKIELAHAPCAAQMTCTIKGRDLIEDAPRTLQLKAEEVRQALAEPIGHIVETVRTALEVSPAETSADIADRGIALVGGGSLLADLEELLRQCTGLPVIRPEDPLTTVAIGAGRCLEDPALRRSLTSRP